MTARPQDKPPRSVWVSSGGWLIRPSPLPGWTRYDLHRPKSRREAKQRRRKAGRRKGWTSTDARCLKLGRSRKATRAGRNT